MVLESAEGESSDIFIIFRFRTSDLMVVVKVITAKAKSTLGPP